MPLCHKTYPIVSQVLCIIHWNGFEGPYYASHSISGLNSRYCNVLLTSYIKINLVVLESQTQLTYTRKEKMDWFSISVMYCHNNAASETTIKSWWNTMLKFVLFCTSVS